jgi:hypothetical protein
MERNLAVIVLVLNCVNSQPYCEAENGIVGVAHNGNVAARLKRSTKLGVSIHTVDL